MPRRIKIPRDKLLKQLFEKVQKIPYQVCQFDKNDYHLKEVVNTAIKQGDCRHKSRLLYNLLQQNIFDAEKIKVVFDWKDLPIPKEILGILKSGTRWSHDSLKVKINERLWVDVDCTWNLELGEKGFPVTEDWDGASHTKQITTGKLESYPAEDFKKEEHDIHIDKEEALAFADALNKWLKK
jgi:hypothetical protein